MAKPYQYFAMRDLIHYSLEELRAIEQTPIIVQCDDGDVETIIEEIILSWFLWEMHRQYPKTPCLVSHVMANITITPKTHTQYLAVIQKDAWFANRSHEYESLLPYNQLCYKIYNNLYNFMSGDLLPFITSISIVDYLEVLEHPRIKEANEWIRNKESVKSQDIQHVYDIITEVLDKDPTLVDNPLSVAFKHRIVSIGQILQDLGPRGFVADIDSHVFPKPIATGYAYGITDLSDYIVESRTGTMSELMTEEPMRNSEYLNRLLQMSGSRLRTIRYYDCGTTSLSDWFVDTKSKLDDLNGMYFLNEETGQQEPIDPKKHGYLVGSTIKLRTLWDCKHKERDAFCAKCYGDLAHNLLETDNIGHIAAIEFQSDRSQKILSFKHYTGSASDYGIYIDEPSTEYFYIDREKYTIKANTEDSLKGTTIKVESRSVRGLESVAMTRNWKHISPVRVSYIVEITLIDADGNEHVLQVADKDNPVHFSLPALKYLLNSEYTLDAEGFYHFPMDNWDYTQPVFVIPKVQFDMVEYADMLTTFIKGPQSGNSKEKQATIIDFEDPIEALVTFHDLVASQLKVALPHLQVILFTSWCQDPDNGDYRPPLDKRQGKFVSHSRIMRKSSMTLSLGYEIQETDVFDPTNYLGMAKMYSPYDHLFLGNDIPTPE